MSEADTVASLNIDRSTASTPNELAAAQREGEALLNLSACWAFKAATDRCCGKTNVEGLF